LPENVNEFFGLFASERQNVLKAVEHVRSSPLISPQIPVHGLLVDIESGRLEWLVNGYQTLDAMTRGLAPSSTASTLGTPSELALQLGEMKTPSEKIGELSDNVKEWLPKLHLVETEVPESDPPPRPSLKSIPPPIRVEPRHGKDPRSRR
jgi:carbonic anhydrase